MGFWPGEIVAMYSNPSYNDNRPNAPCSDGCQLNRATQGRYPPGSTFKVVTATAAIDSGKYTPTSVVDVAIATPTFGALVMSPRAIPRPNTESTI